jgi:hypothetical protein
MTMLVLSPDAASRGHRFTRERKFDWQAVKPHNLWPSVRPDEIREVR